MVASSFDGVSAFDVVSRRAMLAALRRIPGGDLALRSIVLWQCLREDDAGVVHHIWQGEGGEQGDPVMPNS